ncbi:type II toxin-antitoxin system HicB family antitoxin [Halomarina pelagica]|uniref:type II toxin-antitoxin system HicB family antitoxin n=1 Tax=Halomarina pelagica TaxID=2961599 RepID=UPI0020C1D371|nr:type II toxin-antitoxin system HicB family antitoxin [Halomarina sp. BND7]
MSTGREIRLLEGPDRWTAVDEETGVTATGETRRRALGRLDAAVARYVAEDRSRSDAQNRLGKRLAGRFADIDVDSVASVREIRERE